MQIIRKPWKKLEKTSSGTFHRFVLPEDGVMSGLPRHMLGQSLGR